MTVVEQAKDGVAARAVPPRRAWTRWGLLAAALIVAVVAPSIVSIDLVAELNLVLFAITGAVALQLLTGIAGQLSLGSAALMAVGAFTVALIHERAPDVPFPMLLVAAGVTGAVIGLVVGLPALRLRGLYLVIATLALHFVVIFVLQRVQESGAGAVGYLVDRPILGVDFYEDTAWYYVLLAVAVASTAVVAWCKRSATGRAWMMVRDNEIAAAALGLDIARLKLAAFVLSSFIIGVQGGLFAYGVGVVTYDTFPLTLAIQYIAIIIIGGLGSIAGVWLGAAFVIWGPLLITDALQAVVPSADAGVAAQVRTLAYGLAIVLFMLFLPKGLGGLLTLHRRRAAA